MSDFGTHSKPFLRRVPLVIGGLAILVALIPSGQRALIVCFVAAAALLIIPVSTKKIEAYRQFVIPTIVVILAITFIPLLLTVLLSFVRVNGTTIFDWPFPFVGLDNYLRLFSDRIDLLALWRTAEFSLIAVGIEVGLGIAIGFLLARSDAPRGILRALFVLPVVVPPIIACMLWRAMFDQSFGLVNKLLSAAGIEGVPWLSLSIPNLFGFWPPLGQFLNLRPGLAAALVAEIWQWTPFVAIVVAAALRTIPAELEEWSRTQGARAYERLKYVYLPFIGPVISIVFLLRLIDCMKTYDAVWTFFGNNVETATAAIRVTIYALEIRDYGLGSALSILYLAVASILLVAFTKRLLVRIPSK